MGCARGVGPGGISGLVALIERDGEAIDADLQERYGLGVGDVVAGRVTFRRLKGLLSALPVDGTAVWRKRRREAPAGGKSPAADLPDEWWTPERDLMASLIDIGNSLMWAKTEDARKGINRPKPLRRPGVVDADKRYGTAADPATVMALLRPSSALGEGVQEREPGEGPDDPEDDAGDGEAGSPAGPVTHGDEGGS